MLVTSLPADHLRRLDRLDLGSMPGLCRCFLCSSTTPIRAIISWLIMQGWTGVPARAGYAGAHRASGGDRHCLWDSLMVCVRPGSLDASIVPETEEPNDFFGAAGHTGPFAPYASNGK